jgi:hypothetical protein
MRVYGKREGYGEPDAAPSHVTRDTLVSDAIRAYEWGVLTDGEAKTLIREHFGLGETSVAAPGVVTGGTCKWYGADGREIQVTLP